MFQQQPKAAAAVLVPDQKHNQKQVEMMSMASAPDESFDDSPLQPRAPPPAGAPPPLPPPAPSAIPSATVVSSKKQQQLVYQNNNSQPAQQVVPVAYDYDDNSTAPGKPGYNKLCRDQAKLMLVLTTAFLFVNACGPALASSALAIFILKRGTFWSHKNFKWFALSCISFLVSATGYFWVRGSNEINPNRAYGTTDPENAAAVACPGCYWFLFGCFV
jgi:hypothetical protein